MKHYKVDLTDEEIKDLLLQLRCARTYLFLSIPANIEQDTKKKIDSVFTKNLELQDKLKSILLQKSTEQRDSEDNK